ncbi:hypothetical protein IFT59_18895 [Rhizobium sp. CFBP 8752]|uniref:DUF6941 family protein n=1 Tax=Rhizobium sp. CFBP 8752 TaxID=2775301 RepID=UPI00178756F9|nr:hypothetical protein [Rhizobium sp. CFBP 8752]MBD8665312.1 hypothetical protein [Rhizobium sp. CFBP 8752]
MRIHNLTVCDNIRVEDNGKFILIGVYTNAILFPQLPAQFNFNIWVLLEAEQLGKSNFAFRGRMPDFDVDLFEITGEINAVDLNQWTPMAFGAPVLIGQPGKVAIEVKFDGGEWELLRTMNIARGPVPSLPRPPL